MLSRDCYLRVSNLAISTALLDRSESEIFDFDFRLDLCPSLLVGDGQRINYLPFM